MLVAIPARAQQWEEIGTEEGVTIWQREIPGSSLVEFRGRGIVDASFKKILAVFHDDKRKTEWMNGCVDNKRLRVLGPGRNIFYNRTGSNFPLVSDRDVILESATDVWRDKRRIRIDAWSVDDPTMPPIDGVVRMPDLRASWVLTVVEGGKTEVDYTVRADPGGDLPAWVVNWAAQSIPRKTILNLRSQVQKDGYDKDLAYVEAAFDWKGF
jgi:hypothetical protein